MKGKSLKNKILTGVIVGGLMMSMGVAAFANDADSSQSNQNNNQSAKVERGERKGFGQIGKRGAGFFGERSNIGVKNVLDSLIEEGMITSEEAEQFLEKQEAKRAEELEKIEEEKAAQLENGLNALVEKEILTEDDINTIKTFWESEKEERAKERELLKNMTAEERKTYSEEHKGEQRNMMGKLVEEGILTEEQVKEISGLLSGDRGGNHPSFKKEVQASVEK